MPNQEETTQHHCFRQKKQLRKDTIKYFGQIPKHMIVKEANRDSLIYGMLNSDWDKGARAFLYKKLHGAATQKVDAAIVGKEEAAQEQVEQLREKREAEAKLEDKKKA